MVATFVHVHVSLHQSCAPQTRQCIKSQVTTCTYPYMCVHTCTASQCTGWLHT